METSKVRSSAPCVGELCFGGFVAVSETGKLFGSGAFPLAFLGTCVDLLYEGLESIWDFNCPMRLSSGPPCPEFLAG